MIRSRLTVPALAALALATGTACNRPIYQPPWVAGEELARAEPVPAPAPVAAAVVPPASASDPTATFAALQKRLIEAKSVEMAVQVESSAPYPSLLTGTVQMRAGNELELSVDGEFAGAKVNLRLKSAGGRLVGGAKGDGDATIDQATPPALGEAVVVGLLGMGLLHNLALVSSGLPPDRADGGASEWVVTSNHVWDTGKDAVVDGHQARALTFDIAVSGKDVADATLWLDADSGLPLKREQTVRFVDDATGQEGTMKAVETYLKFAVTP